MTSQCEPCTTIDPACAGATADVIEIPEPDYDMSDDDGGENSPVVVVADKDEVKTDSPSVDDAATGCHGNAERCNSSDSDGIADNCSSSSCKGAVVGAADTAVAAAVEPAALDEENAAGDDASKPYNFGEVRAKLEAFSRESSRALAASVSEPVDIPEPDYSDDDDVTGGDSTIPVLTKEQRSLQRELQFNQKLGINVLSKKSELQKEMEKRKERQQEREEEEKRRQNRTSFDIRLEERAQKIIMAEQKAKLEQCAEDDQQQPEFLKVHSKMCRTK